MHRSAFGVHQPIEVAYSVLDALDSCGVTAANDAVRAAVADRRSMSPHSLTVSAYVR